MNNRCKYLTIFQMEKDGDWYWSWHTSMFIGVSNDLYAKDHDGPFSSPVEAFESAKGSEEYHD